MLEAARVSHRALQRSATDKFAVSGFSSLTGEMRWGITLLFSSKGDVSLSTEGETPPGEEIFSALWLRACERAVPRAATGRPGVRLGVQG